MRPPGDHYLSVGITKDIGVLHIEVNNQDGKDHTAETVSVAKAILTGFGGQGRRGARLSRRCSR
jgi:hypothetical protein